MFNDDAVALTLISIKFKKKTVYLTGNILSLATRFNVARCNSFKDRDSTVPKRGSVFIGRMTPDGAIWSRYQRAVLMR